MITPVMKKLRLSDVASSYYAHKIKFIKYSANTFQGNPTLGEYLNPAEDCSDIVRRRRDAKTGLYWIKGLKKTLKVQLYCLKFLLD